MFKYCLLIFMMLFLTLFFYLNKEIDNDILPGINKELLFKIEVDKIKFFHSYLFKDESFFYTDINKKNMIYKDRNNVKKYDFIIDKSKFFFQDYIFFNSIEKLNKFKNNVYNNYPVGKSMEKRNLIFNNKRFQIDDLYLMYYFMDKNEIYSLWKDEYRNLEYLYKNEYKILTSRYINNILILNNNDVLVHFKKNNKQYISLNGKEIHKFDYIYDLKQSNDGKKYAFFGININEDKYNIKLIQNVKEIYNMDDVEFNKLTNLSTNNYNYFIYGIDKPNRVFTINSRSFKYFDFTFDKNANLIYIKPQDDFKVMELFGKEKKYKYFTKIKLVNINNEVICLKLDENNNISFDEKFLFKDKFQYQQLNKKNTVLFDETKFILNKKVIDEIQNPEFLNIYNNCAYFNNEVKNTIYSIDLESKQIRKFNNFTDNKVIEAINLQSGLISTQFKTYYICFLITGNYCVYFNDKLVTSYYDYISNIVVNENEQYFKFIGIQNKKVYLVTVELK